MAALNFDSRLTDHQIRATFASILILLIRLHSTNRHQIVHE